MRENNYTDKQKFWSQMIKRWVELDRMPIKVFCRQYGVEDQSFYYWRDKFDNDHSTKEVRLVQVAGLTEPSQEDKIAKHDPEPIRLSTTQSTSMMRVTYGDFTVELSENFNPKSFKELIDVLGGVAC